MEAASAGGAEGRGAQRQAARKGEEVGEEQRTPVTGRRKRRSIRMQGKRLVRSRKRGWEREGEAG